MDLDSGKWLQKVVDHLEFTGNWTWGRGWRSHVNRKLKKSSGFLHQGIHRKNLQISTLLSVVAVLGKDIPQFLSEISGGNGKLDPFARVQAHGHQLKPELPRPVTQIKRRLDQMEKLSAENLNGREKALVQEIAEGRYVDPKAAARAAEAALDGLLREGDAAASRVAIPLLAEWASAKRRCDDPDSALWILLHCLRWSASLPGRPHHGDLLQRLAHCYSDHFGDFEGSLTISERALAEHLTAGNSCGIGRALVNRGSWLHYLERYPESLAANKRALEFLPADDTKSLYYSHAHQAHTYRALKKIGHMRAEIEKARAYQPAALHAATLRWLEGTVASEAGEFEIAERAFLDCCAVFEESSPVNTSLVTLELVDLYLVNGHSRQAYALARNMARLLEPLKRFPIAAAAVAKLVQRALEARLSKPLLETTRRAISRARAHRCARAE